MSSETLEIAVEQAILGGCTMIQLREKECSSLEFFQTAFRVKQITDKYRIPLIINDRIDIAIAVDAKGVHVGQSDIPAKTARMLIGRDKILGVSASTLAEAVRAQTDGADYLGVGAMYATGTKTDATITPMEELIKIRKMTVLPIVVIGGINPKTLPDFKGIGIDGIAVVSAVISQPDISGAAAALKKLFQSN